MHIEKIAKNQFIFIKWSEALEDQIDVIYPWTPFILGKVSAIVEEDETEMYMIVLYHCLAYDLKYATLKHGSALVTKVLLNVILAT